MSCGLLLASSLQSLSSSCKFLARSKQVVSLFSSSEVSCRFVTEVSNYVMCAALLASSRLNARNGADSLCKSLEMTSENSEYHLTIMKI